MKAVSTYAERIHRTNVLVYQGECATLREFSLFDPLPRLVPVVCIDEVFKHLLQQRGLSAAQISFALKLPMADSIILATARVIGATLWMQEEHFKDLEGVRFCEKKG